MREDIRWALAGIAWVLNGLVTIASLIAPTIIAYYHGWWWLLLYLPSLCITVLGLMFMRYLIEKEMFR